MTLWVKLAALFVVVASVSAAGYTARGWKLRAESAEAQVRSYDLALKANAKVVEDYANDIARLRSAPRNLGLQLCRKVPAAAGGPSAASPGLVDAGSGAEIEDTLRGCYEELSRQRRLVDAIQAREKK